MITEYGFYDTTDDIRMPTEAENAHYAGIAADYAEDARALLMTCRHLMTGHEIDTCENATGDHDDDAGFDAWVIDRLCNQFAREIAAWKNGDGVMA